jgi:RNA polymerase sigma-70 factor (ECF subfamily)
MNPESLEPLLEKLCAGDMAVAKKVFLAYEPYLRKVIRRQLPQRLRAKFDSVDVVQSVWADLLDGYRAGNWNFPDVRRLQAFLVQAARNRFIDRFRKHRVAFAKEQPLGGLHTSEMPIALEPRALELLEAQELWQQMLALCRPEHRELLELKRQGVPMEELVTRTGLHPGSIRRILRNLARKLALAENGVEHAADVPPEQSPSGNASYHSPASAEP